MVTGSRWEPVNFQGGAFTFSDKFMWSLALGPKLLGEWQCFDIVWREIAGVQRVVIDVVFYRGGLFDARFVYVTDPTVGTASW